MSRYSWGETLITAEGDGTQLSNSVTQTSIIPAAAKLALPANWMDLGRKLKIIAQGRASCVITTPGTLQFFVMLGAVAAFSSGAFNLNIVAKTNVSWWLEIDLTCRAIGSGTSANLMGIGFFQSELIVGSAANTAGGNGSLVLPVSAPAVGTGFDSTAAQVIDLQAQFSVNTNPTNLTLHQYELIARN